MISMSKIKKAICNRKVPVDYIFLTKNTLFHPNSSNGHQFRFLQHSTLSTFNQSTPRRRALRMRVAFPLFDPSSFPFPRLHHLVFIIYVRLIIVGCRVAGYLTNRGCRLIQNQSTRPLPSPTQRMYCSAHACLGHVQCAYQGPLYFSGDTLNKLSV